MFSVNIKCDNLPEITKTISDIADGMDGDIADVFKAVLFDIEKKAKYLAPVDTGHLRRNIDVKVTPPESYGKGSIIEGIIFNTVNYAPYVHSGTRRMKARPYITNAIYNYGPAKIIRDLEKKLLKEKRGLT
jgi:HK97 gp10 family phage protein